MGSTVAFIGLGVMGGPMARNMIGRGFALSVYDVSERAMAAFADGSCRCAASPEDAAAGADVVVTMLPDIPHVREALLGPQGACRSLRPGGLVIEMSTVGVAGSLGLARDLNALGFRMIDAPVGRPPEDAPRGTLIVMAGGSDPDMAEARPLLEAVADTIVLVGPQGDGIKLKLVNNYMAMVGMLMTAEALALAKAVGLDRETAVRVISTTAAGRGQIIVNYPKKVLAGDVTPDFPLRMGVKDIGHALDLGAEVRCPLLLGALTRQCFSLADAQGRGGEDCTAILLFLEDLMRAPGSGNACTGVEGPPGAA